MTVIEHDEPATVTLPNALDCEWAHQEREALLNIVESTAADDIALHCHEVEFIDSVGIGTLVSLHRRCRCLSKNLRIFGIKGQPLALVRQTSLAR